MNKLAILLFFLIPLVCAADEFRIYDDDPLMKEADTEDAANVQEWDIPLVYDFVENFFLKPGDRALNVRAKDINTIDEVPDSNWYMNRESLTPERVAKGPDESSGPAPGKWTVIAAKSNGVTPGFTVRDSNEDVWFIKFDPPGYIGMATGTEVVVTKLFWALGYHVPENYISVLRFEDLTIGKGAKFKSPNGKKRPMKISDIQNSLRLAARNQDGSYRVIASKALPGKPLGGFRFYDTRPDDPNDIIPHEHRRSLRGYGVFAAWVNHVDSKSINSLDVLVKDGGRSVVRHYLLDFGATLGSASLAPHEFWEGYETLYEGAHPIGVNTIGFGFPVETWRKIPYYEEPSIGRFPLNNKDWNPDSWQPREPNPAFLRARPDDKFWAARKLMDISNDMIRAAVHTGQFNDPKSEEFLVNALIERRDAIGRKYLTAINPIVNPTFNGNKLTFENAAAKYGFAQSTATYTATWYSYTSTKRIGETTGNADGIPVPENLGTFVKVEISASPWKDPVDAYFRHEAGSWKLVGLERQP